MCSSKSLNTQIPINLTMLFSCYIGESNVGAGIITLVLTAIAMYISLIAHPQDKRGKVFGYGFALLSVFTFLLFPCWAWLIALIEIIISLVINKDSFRILKLS